MVMALTTNHCFPLTLSEVLGVSSVHGTSNAGTIGLCLPAQHELGVADTKLLMQE